MQIKVCGMRDPANIRQVIKAGPDILGFVFYSGSVRFAGNILHEDLYELIPQRILKAGIFVNEDPDRIVAIAEKLGLQFIQLHGDEPPEVCRVIRQKGMKVIRAFGIGEGFQWNVPEPYQHVCDYFLFDTRTERFGGSGRKFSWDILESYRFHKPFFLSGGISMEDIPVLKRIDNPWFYGVDINSKFEKEAGIKDVDKVTFFIQQIKNQ
ncbi:MAG: phosphoribosylanthranilate isomerase [Bacteroidales bacterium]|nr:phosphoribosylanthranilate isomerase [Bacteroidales bacterium]